MGTTKRPRWWPLLIIVGLDLLFAIIHLMGEAANEQHRKMIFMGVQLIALLLMSIWLIFFSRIRWRMRFAIAGVMVIGALALSQLLEVREVSGDVVPILEWRWTKSPDESLAVEAPDPSVTVDVDAVSHYGFPQFLGPNRNGVIEHVVLKQDWQAHPPKLLWRRAVGAGWSGFSIAAPFAFTMEQRGDRESVTCYALEDGSLLWSQGVADQFASTIGGDGPRATPTLHEGRVYSHGATGYVQCLDFSGNLLWRRNILKELGQSAIEWGISCSPLVAEGRVWVSVGSGGHALCALDINDGSTIWCAGDETASYASPSFFELDGERQIVMVESASVTAYRPDDGSILWRQPWPNQQPNVAQPVQIGSNQLLVSTGYGIGSKLFNFAHEAEQWTVTEVWQSSRMKAKFTNLVVLGPFLYGLDDGTLSCLDLNDGSRKWRGKRYGHGQVLRLNEDLLVLSERGELALVAAQPDQFHERASIEALTGKTWNTMALDQGLLLIRNGREAACYQLALEN